jgi:hypothetical protein
MTTRTDSAHEQNDCETTIDHAIKDCRSNISRHTRAPLIEVFFGLVLVAAVASVMINLAQIQGGENDQKRFELRSRVTDIQMEVRRATDNYQYLLVDLKDAEPKVEEAAKNIDDSASEKLKTLKENADGLKKRIDLMKNRVDGAQKEFEEASKELAAYRGKPIISDTMMYGAGALLVLIIGVLSSTYRFHLKEISKNEQYKMAFLRIRIAATNAGTPGFDGEVRVALTNRPFDIQVEDSASLRHRKIESPMPGNPTSDLGTSVINRLLDEIEIIFQPKEKTANK